MNDILKPLLLVVVGFVAGFLNVTAGGGSLLTLPILIFLGLPASMANGTNRIAILIQNIFATARFHQFKVIPKGLTMIVAVPAVIGSIIGARIAIDIDDVLFRKILAVVMFLLLPSVLFRLPKQPNSAALELSSVKKFWLGFAFLGVGLYGGFIQGGIGFLIIAVLSVVGFDLVRTNALKVLVILLFSPFALMVFILNNDVDYLTGLTLAVGNAAGAWVGSKVVVEKGHQFLRWLVTLTLLAFAIRLLFA